MMEVIFDLKNCFECKHKSHTGGFDPKGARPVCHHLEAKKCAEENGVSKKYFRTSDSMLIKDAGKIPNWCPLRHGYKYQ